MVKKLIFALAAVSFSSINPPSIEIEKVKDWKEQTTKTQKGFCRKMIRRLPDSVVKEHGSGVLAESLWCYLTLSAGKVDDRTAIESLIRRWVNGGYWPQPK